MDECVYQCPECNFNADNLTELDNHMDDFHAATSHQQGGKFASSLVHNADDNNEHNDPEDDFYADTEDDSHKLIYDDEDDNNNYNDDTTDNDLYIDAADAITNPQPLDDYTHLTNTADIPSSARMPPNCLSTPLQQHPHQPAPTRRSVNNNNNTNNTAQKRQKAAALAAAAGNQQPVINSDNHYERQYTCKRCGFFTNNPRAVLYHRKEFHFEKINVHECIYCQYASQYSGKVERHTLLRHKIDTNNTPKKQAINRVRNENDSFTNNNNISLNLTSLHTNHTRKEPLDSSLSNRTLNLNSSSLTTLASATSAKPADTDHTLITKYQCNKCPCKYKRSNDLSKHLKMKHAVVAQRLSDYLTHTPVESMWSLKDENTDLNDFNDAANTSPDQFNDTGHSLSEASASNRSKNTQPGRAKLSTLAPKLDTPSSNNNTGSYECPYCTYYSNGNDAEYLLHVKDHLSGKSFRCVLCNSVYKYRGDCVVHLKRKHQKADMFAQNYVERFNLESVDIGQVCVLLKPKVTEENENEEKLFGCAYCDYKANYKGDVFKHQTRRHPGVVKNVTALAENPGLYQGGHQRTGRGNSTILEAGNTSLGGENSQVYGRFQSNRKQAVKLSPSGSSNRLVSANAGHEDTESYDNGENYYYNNSQVQESANYSNVNSDLNEDQYTANDDDTENDLLDDTDYNHPDDLSMFDEAAPAADQDDLDPAAPPTHTHDQPKPFKCPKCTTRAAFKWDIEKHLRKIHNDYTSEVVCLNDQEARTTALFNSLDKVNNTRSGTILASVLSGNIRRPASSLSSLSSSSFTYNNAPTNNKPAPTCASSSSSSSKSLEPTMTSSYLANLKFLARRRGKHALRERKFKCPLCPRTSKWQWDIRKHMRTVHRGEEEGVDVIVLKEKELVGARRAGGMNEVAKRPVSLADMNSSLSAGTDPTGNKKFQCSACPYRSNWKADLLRHLRKRHYIGQPAQENVIVLEAAYAADSLAEYEMAHGMHVRKRSRSELEPAFARDELDAGNDCKRIKGEPLLDDIDQINQLQQQENSLELFNRSKANQRLPVSIAELNIKPYKCLKCGFRSDRKSDTLRHIRVKHAMSVNAVKFLRILSISEASESIEQYENMRLYKKIKNFSSASNASNSNSPMNTSADNNRTFVDEEEETKSQASFDHSHLQQRRQQQAEQAFDFYRCPFCKFKNCDKHVMRRHLVIHFSGAQTVRVTNPVYRCSICTFRSKWQFFVKRHITQQHLSVRNAYVLKYPAKSRYSKEEMPPSGGEEPAQSPDYQSPQNDVPATSTEEINTDSDVSNSQIIENNENKQLATITLTDQDGQEFKASYHVINGGPQTPVNAVNAIPAIKLDQNAGPLAFRKRASTTYVCDSCPFSTKVYSNLKQHLYGHGKCQAGFVKCRYCSFNAGHQRLLRQHEVLHEEFEEATVESSVATAATGQLKRNSLAKGMPTIHA